MSTARKNHDYDPEYARYDIAELDTLRSQAANYTPTLKHGRKSPTPRRVRFVPADLMNPLPDALDTFAALSDDERPDVLVWAGDDPGRRMIRADVDEATASGWAVKNYRADARAATFIRASDGVSFDVRSSAAWFGRERFAPALADAWEELGKALRGGFGSWAYLWPTPTMTGQELLRGSLPYGAAYPVLPVDVLELMWNAVPNGGRTELFTALGGRNMWMGWLPELYNLDMRWAYASALRGLPVGPVAHDTRRTQIPLDLRSVGYEPSFYKFRTRVPARWDHIGILPAREHGQTVYPSQPNYEFWGWATGAEIQVALTHGWDVTASQRIHWPQTNGHDVLRSWSTILRAIRGQQLRQQSHAAQLVAGAIRSLVVHTVGSFNRARRWNEGFVPRTSRLTMPPGAVPLPATNTAGEFTGWQWRNASLTLDEWVHPEWYLTVVGRVRAKATKRALQMPVNSLVSIRTDGILTTETPDVTPDDGVTPGQWRIKWHMTGAGISAPRDVADVLEILNAATADGRIDDEGTDHTDDDDEGYGSASAEWEAE